MNELTLVRKIKEKDEDGLYFFIEEYGKIMKGVISKTLWQYPHLWGEVLNDSMLSIWENINSFDSDRSSFKNWCAAVCKYKAIDALRVENKYKADSLEEITVSKENEMGLGLEVEEALKVLSKKDEEIFRSIFIMGNTYEETGKKLGMTTDNVYARVSRGRKFLKKWQKGEI